MYLSLPSGIFGSSSRRKAALEPEKNLSMALQASMTEHHGRSPRLRPQMLPRDLISFET